MKPRPLQSLKAELKQLEREKEIIPIRIKALKQAIKTRTANKKRGA